MNLLNPDKGSILHFRAASHYYLIQFLILAAVDTRLILALSISRLKWQRELDDLKRCSVAFERLKPILVKGNGIYEITFNRDNFTNPRFVIPNAVRNL